jgi:hypothetical protein
MRVDPSGAMPPEYIPSYCLPTFVSLPSLVAQTHSHIMLILSRSPGKRRYHLRSPKGRLFLPSRIDVTPRCRYAFRYDLEVRWLFPGGYGFS